jgi:lipoyl(octanoyl) transferase
LIEMGAVFNELKMLKSFRLIRHPPGDGRYNMAVDEALLESVGLTGSSPVLRLYGFAPPTLSVGRFQRTEGVIDFDKIYKDEVIFVRRPSGGQAVLHSDELTYSVFLGKHHFESFTKRKIYGAIVPLLIAGLKKIGAHEAHAVRTAKGNSHNPDCFASTSEYEIDGSIGRKLVGSAQMLTRTAVLQHGSIPLNDGNRNIIRYLIADSEISHLPSSLNKETEHEISFDRAQRAFAEAYGQTISATDSILTDVETAGVARLLESKYMRDEWNRKY